VSVSQWRCRPLRRVAIVGVGLTKLEKTTPKVSYKELMFEAAEKAYADAGVDPRRDVESFVCSSEDFYEGTSIFDEYVPDQIGGALKPVCTIAADGIYSLATAYMQILTGVFDIVAIEAHSKASDIVNISPIYDLALDPVYVRPLGLNANFIAGLEMNAFIRSSRATLTHCSRVIEKNRKNALSNPLAMNTPYTPPSRDNVLSYPLAMDDAAPLADGAAVVVLAAEGAAKSLRDDAVWIKGAGWASDSPNLETRDWGKATYATLAAKQAYKQARIRNPAGEVQVAEVDDTYSFKELEHAEALGLVSEGRAHNMLEQGDNDLGGRLPINPSGGSIGMGHTLEMSGLVRVIEIVEQLRGTAGKHQVSDAEMGIAQSWRGVPTASGAVVVLSR
jgi:acetyl-CoA C-acetyltransferase